MMNNIEAALILDPATTVESYMRYETPEQWLDAVNAACVLGANALRENDRLKAEIELIRQEYNNMSAVAAAFRQLSHEQEDLLEELQAEREG